MLHYAKRFMPFSRFSTDFFSFFKEKKEIFWKKDAFCTMSRPSLTFSRFLNFGCRMTFSRFYSRSYGRLMTFSRFKERPRTALTPYEGKKILSKGKTGVREWKRGVTEGYSLFSWGFLVIRLSVSRYSGEVFSLNSWGFLVISWDFLVIRCRKCRKTAG